VSASAPGLHVADCGDSALLITVTGDGDRPWQVAREVADALRAAAPDGLVDVIPSYASVFVAFDPLRATATGLRELVAHPGAPAPAAPAREFLVPVVYGGEHGTDLDDVAAVLDRGTAEVVALHTAAPWTVRLLGPPLGMPMTDGGRTLRSVPRRADPRTRVPAGSVGVSGIQSVVYPFAMPGGWQLIGRTPARLVDLGGDPVTDYRPGDALRFVAVDAASWSHWARPLADVQAELADAVGRG
jgi:KipI family sensor histidine kinase inhibitor